jgi:hypothetical protein
MTVEELLDWPGDGAGNKFDGPRAMVRANTIDPWKASVLGCALTGVYEGTRSYRSSES